MTKQIMKRRQAMWAGQNTYHTGKPCKHGHVADRYVSGGGCVECTRMKANGEPLPGQTVITLRLKVHKDDKEALELFASQLLGARS